MESGLGLGQTVFTGSESNVDTFTLDADTSSKGLLDSILGGSAGAAPAGEFSLSGGNGSTEPALSPRAGSSGGLDSLSSPTGGAPVTGAAPAASNAPAAVPSQGSYAAAAAPAGSTTSASGNAGAVATAGVAPANGTAGAGAQSGVTATGGGAQAGAIPASGGAPSGAPSGALAQQGGVPQGMPQQYYMQQPMFVDQNGQPIFYQQPVDAQGVPVQMGYVQGPNGQQYMAQGQYQMAADPSGQQAMYAMAPNLGPRGYGYPVRYDERGYDRGGYEDRGYGGGGGGGRRDRDRYNDRYDRDRGGGRERYSRDRNDGANPGRDPLVDEFRNTFGKSRQWSLRDLLGHVVAFCQDQHGSRFIQQRLEVCNEDEKQLVFEEILLVANPLMTDVFGNYVLQKLFEYGTPDQCEQLGLLLTGQAVNLAMQMYGCRVVQKALEYVNTERLMALVSEFESPPVLLRCVHDSNGNHVIQKCIEIVSRVANDAREHSKEAAEHVAGRIQFIIDTFKGRVKELSSHPYGCRVVQRILEHCPNDQKAIILEELRQCCADLVQDCYGNYVIQFVMQHGWDADRAVLIKEVQQNLLEFSQHKFASNVVEKCLQYASRRDRDEMIWTIINVTFDINNPVDSKGHCVLESMVRDPYANYVVQKVIDVSDERQRAAIIRYVRDNINQLRRYTYGKHIIVRLEKLTNEKF